MEDECSWRADGTAASACNDLWEGEDNTSVRLGLGCFVFWEVKRKIGEDWRDDGKICVGCCDMTSGYSSAVREERWEAFGSRGSEDRDRKSDG